MIADRRNSRPIEVAPNKQIVRELRRRTRDGASPALAGTTPLDNGDVPITGIHGTWISRVTRAGQRLRTVPAPQVSYLSDADPMHDGEGMFDPPSLALELPNGDVILNDDLRHRLRVIDRHSQAILWPYGVTDPRGTQAGALHVGATADPGSPWVWRPAATTTMRPTHRPDPARRSRCTTGAVREAAAAGRRRPAGVAAAEPGHRRVDRDAAHRPAVRAPGRKPGAGDAGAP